MSKVSFLARWGIVFGALGFFTLYSASAIMGSQNRAYADAIKHNDQFRHSKNFVVFNDDEDGNDGHGHHQGKGHTKMICAIDQDQLNALRAAYSTAVFTTTEVGAQPKGIVDVDRTPGVTKHAIRETIGLDTSGPKCQIIKTPQSFLLFLLPGVSFIR